MHKATLLEATLNFAIKPEGPILIKAGETSGADPTRPDMEFVRTKRNGTEQIYIPGASLKGVVRSHCERICRSLDGESRYENAQKHAKEYGDDFVPPLADNPLLSNQEYIEYEKGGDDTKFSSGVYFDKLKTPDSALVYRHSSFTSQLFGHTSLASRVRFADAYLTDKAATQSDEHNSKTANPNDDRSVLRLEERNGVAIDRVYGSVAVGPFNYEVAVSGTFTTRINFKNITLAQLALVGLALRDLNEGRVAIGFGKSRGLGRISLDLQSLTMRYPVCTLQDNTLALLQNKKKVVSETDHFAGIGALTQAAGGFNDYRFPEDDAATLPTGIAMEEDEFMGVSLKAVGQEQIYAIWRTCMPRWREVVGL